MPISTDDIIRVAAVLSRDLLTDILVNVFHLKCVDDNGLGEQDLVDDLVELVETGYDSFDSALTDNVNFDRIELYNITDGAALPDEAWPTLTEGGEAVAEQTSDGVCFLVYWKTGAPRRIGRKFFGIFTEDHNINGLWNAALNTLMAVTGDNYLNPATPTNGSTWEFGTWGWVDPEDELLGKVFNVFTSAHTTQIPAYQRRRKRGVGA